MTDEPSFTPETLRAELDQMWKNLEHLGNASQHGLAAENFREQARAAESSANFIRQELQAHIKQLYDETTKYLNAVAVVGYAAYFTTWSFTKEQMPHHVSATVGLLGMISVSFFVLWEMWVAFSIRLKGVNEVAGILQNMVQFEDFERLKTEVQAREARRIAIATPVHRLVFSISSLTAIAGGIILMHALYTMP